MISVRFFIEGYQSFHVQNRLVLYLKVNYYIIPDHVFSIGTKIIFYPDRGIIPI